MYVLLLLIVLVLILLSWSSFDNAIKGFLVFIIGYYIGKNFALLDTVFEKETHPLQTAGL